MRIGEAMEIWAAVITAVAALMLLGSTLGLVIGIGGSLLVIAAFIAYAAQVHEYGGEPVKRAESS